MASRALRVFTVKVWVPETEDDNDYSVEIERHGETIAAFDLPLIPALDTIGHHIGRVIEEEG